MADYIMLVSKESKIIYIPKGVGKISEYINKELEKIEVGTQLKLEYKDVPIHILEIYVDYLNKRYYYEKMKEITEEKGLKYTEPYPIPEDLCLEIVKKYL